MTGAPKPPNAVDLGSPVGRHAAELLRSNEALREELRSLRQECARLREQLAAVVSGSQADRERRRAALNLMEDAVEARQALQRENLERRRIEEELRQADRRKDEFLAMLAHELRTPLAPIRNSLGVLRLAGTDKAAIEHVYEMLERQVSHMVRLVDDLLEVSRITRGKIELQKNDVELALVVQSAVEASRPLIDSAAHQLAIDLPEEPIILHADPVRVRQVLANLLNNAAKFTKAGGQIWLTVARAGSMAQISVRDNGRGIPAEMLPKVFELFSQVDRTYNRTQAGLGIGLTLVRTLVEMHGGQVEAKSEGPDMGSEFVVRLPVAAAVGGRRLRDQCRAGPISIAPRRMLVVDDNRDAADSLGALLKLLGATVSTAHDGAAALEALLTYRPSVMLLDIGMPAMDGFEVARRARERPEGRDVTLIALTGWAQEEDRRRSLEAGFDFHLVKPVDLSALQAILASLPQDQA
jgi:signal transduction histidine kinase/ActR/RegA family two-component response regulator